VEQTSAGTPTCHDQRVARLLTGRPGFVDLLPRTAMLEETLIAPVRAAEYLDAPWLGCTTV
jgi:hypothetical protein